MGNGPFLLEILTGGQNCLIQIKITDKYIFLLRNGHKQIKFGNFGGGGGGHLKGGQSGSYGEGSNGAQVLSHYTWYTKYRNGFIFSFLHRMEKEPLTP